MSGQSSVALQMAMYVTALFTAWAVVIFSAAEAVLVPIVGVWPQTGTSACFLSSWDRFRFRSTCKYNK